MIADNLQEAYENEELLEALRQNHIIVKLSLRPLTKTNQTITQIALPEFSLPDIDMKQIYRLLPHKKEIKALFDDPNLNQEVQDNVRLFASQYFDFGGDRDEN